MVLYSHIPALFLRELQDLWSCIELSMVWLIALTSVAYLSLKTGCPAVEEDYSCTYFAVPTLPISTSLIIGRCRHTDGVLGDGWIITGSCKRLPPVTPADFHGYFGQKVAVEPTRHAVALSSSKPSYQCAISRVSYLRGWKLSDLQPSAMGRFGRMQK